jgi:hypothetical protein
MEFDRNTQIKQCKACFENIQQALFTKRTNEFMPMVRTVGDELIIKNAIKQNQKKGEDGAGMSLATEMEDLFIKMLENISPDKFKHKKKVDNAKMDSDLYSYFPDGDYFVPLSFKHIGHCASTQLCLNWNPVKKKSEEKNIPQDQKQRTFESAMCLWNNKIKTKRGMWKELHHGIYIIPLYILLDDITYFQKNNKSETLFPNELLTLAMQHAKKEGLFIELAYDHSAGSDFEYNAWLNNPLPKNNIAKI